MNAMRQEWMEAVGQQSRLLWECGATHADNSNVEVPWPFAVDNMNEAFVFAVHCHLQELWSDWGSP